MDPQQATKWSAVLCVLGVVSCGAKVVFDEPDGSSAATGGGGAGVGGAAPDGGAPPDVGGFGGQGGQPDPGPACGSLAWVGEPILLPRLFNPGLPQLAALHDGSVGVLYKDTDVESPIHVDVVLSNVLEGAFDRWPPRVSETLRHYQGALENSLLGFSSRRDGTFGVSAGFQALLGRFDQAEAQVLTGFFGVALQHGQAMGAYLLQGTFEHLKLFRLALPSGDLTPSGELVSGLCSFPTFGDATEEGLLFSMGANPSCAGSTSHEQLYLSSSEVQPMAAFDLPFVPTTRALLTGPNKSWFAAGGAGRPSLLYAIESQGKSIGPVLTIEADEGALTPVFARWADGVVSVRHTKADGLLLEATDGVSVVRSEGSVSNEEISPQEQLAVVSGREGRSVLVAYYTNRGIAVARADCTTPQP